VPPSGPNVQYLGPAFWLFLQTQLKTVLVSTGFVETSKFGPPDYRGVVLAG
jgi:hypothetical protein